MLVRVVPQQAQSANQSNQANPPSARRPERPDGRSGPSVRNSPSARERPSSPDAIGSGANEVIVRNGVPVVPPIPAIPVHRGADGPPPSLIPPQAVDIAYGFFAMVAAILIGWPLSRAFSRRLERGGQTAAIPPAVTEQLQRIEQAVDAMAVEVERISEAQRYFTKLHAGKRPSRTRSHRANAAETTA